MDDSRVCLAAASSGVFPTDDGDLYVFVEMDEDSWDIIIVMPVEFTE